MNNLTQMVPVLNLLTAKQKRDLNNAYQTGGSMHVRPTKKQMQPGGFWGALASSGIPLAINLLPKLFGKSLQVDKMQSCRSIPVFVPPMNKKKMEFHLFIVNGQCKTVLEYKKKETKKRNRITNFNVRYTTKSNI